MGANGSKTVTDRSSHETERVFVNTLPKANDTPTTVVAVNG